MPQVALPRCNRIRDPETVNPPPGKKLCQHCGDAVPAYYMVGPICFECDEYNHWDKAAEGKKRWHRRKCEEELRILSEVLHQLPFVTPSEGLPYARIARNLWVDEEPLTHRGRHGMRHAIDAVRARYYRFDQCIDAILAGERGADYTAWIVYLAMRDQTAAGSVLGVTQSAISRTIARLEREHPKLRTARPKNENKATGYTDARDAAGSGLYYPGPAHGRKKARRPKPTQGERRRFGPYDELVCYPALGPGHDGDEGPGRLSPSLFRHLCDEWKQKHSSLFRHLCDEWKQKQRQLERINQ